MTETPPSYSAPLDQAEDLEEIEEQFEAATMPPATGDDEQ